jgi:asparagine synthase (glutamine-hydrolysing)
MCWFVGIYCLKDKWKKTLKKSISKISHRWNIINYWNDWNFSWWYLRLATDEVDFCNYSYLDKLLYNWIIYNTNYLSRKFWLNLEKDFDSLVLKESYEKYWYKVLENIRGMFAFSFNKKNSIELIRDTIWIKPLYYTIWKDIFAFSSEIKWLIEICKKYKTSVVEVLPWEIINFNKESFSIIKSNFTYKFYTNFTKDKIIEKSFEECLLKPTIKYLKTWKKIALLLSWWLDSSILLYSLYRNKEIKKKNIIIFSMWFEWSSDNKAIKIIEKDLAIKVNYIKPFSDLDSIKILDKIVYISESKLVRVIKVSIFQYLLAKEIRKSNIDIVISWEWSDEIFFWYDRFYKWIENNKKIEKLFNLFFEKVFFYTLLQRLDRSFSYFTIEWRTPFLDQELIDNIKKISIENKIFNNTDKYILRKYAEKLWIPKEIVYRKKEKMTKWITGKENNYKNNLNWYLEKACYNYFWKSLWSKCLDYYKSNYYINGNDIHSNFNWFLKEEDLIKK